MNFRIDRSVEILRQTPFTLQLMLEDLSDEWTASSGDADSWGVYDVVGHLIHGEETDWIPRAEIILAQGLDRAFVPFDRNAQFSDSNNRSLNDLLAEFSRARSTNLEKLARWELKPEHFEMQGVHPEFGEVTLGQLLATWVVHDLNHIAQIAKILAKKYDSAVGPWKAYLSILK